MHTQDSLEKEISDKYSKDRRNVIGTLKLRKTGNRNRMRGIFIFADSETALSPLGSYQSPGRAESENAVSSLLLDSFCLIKCTLYDGVVEIGHRLSIWDNRSPCSYV